MADAILYHLIANRMREMGYSRHHFHFEPWRYYNPTYAFLNAAPLVHIGCNEWYFLVSRTVPPDLEIDSNSHQFGQDDAQNYASFNIYCIQEFEGLMIFKRTGTGSPASIGIDLEFIRCIPEYDPMLDKNGYDPTAIERKTELVDLF